MGALHEGHLSLVRRAKSENEYSSASIFVNPLQFDDATDLDCYPQTEERDLALLEACGVDFVLIGRSSEFYPDGFRTRIEVGGEISNCLEGALRPGHFQGVATVVAKLFHLFAPQRAYFGWKDMQQCCLVRRMVRDLSLPVEIRACEIVRERDGLALSSRNSLLSHDERERAPAIHAALCAAKLAFEKGETSSDALTGIVRQALETVCELQYVEIRTEEEFLPHEDPIRHGRIVVAVKLGSVRLIDNLPLGISAGL